MKHKQHNSNGMKRHVRILPVFLVAMVGLILGATVPEIWAFEDTSIKWEVNATDKDAGIQIFLDGEGWKDVTIDAPNGREVFSAEVKGRLANFGGTELFLETAEPEYQNLTKLKQLLNKVPTGDYDFSGTTVDGDDLEGEATLTRIIPSGPVIITPSAPGNQCGEVETTDAVISWQSVTKSIFGGPITIVGYEVIVEQEDLGLKFSAKLPPTTTSLTISPEFLEADTEYKFEVLAIEGSGNQTITESCFETSG